MTTNVDSETPAAATGPWLSPNDICRELKIPLQTFYQWRSKRIGPPAYRIGRHLRFDRHDFDAWLLTHADFTASSPKH